VRLFLLPAAMLITALAVACGGGSSADTGDETEVPDATPPTTVTPTTPIPAPPWATSSPTGESPTAPAADTPAPTQTPVPTSDATAPTQATQPPAPTATNTPTLLMAVDVTVVNDLSFSPNRIEVPAGSTINFSWNGNVPHTVSSDDAGFASGAPAKADSLSVVLTTPGTYRFICETHPTTMKGLITVS
jgi:plastocyanin